MSVGLVLEGGGMRGAYTAGVLELFLKEKIHIPYVIGVSAGALTAVSYISKQPKRNYLTFAEYATKPQYASVANLARNGSLFNFDYILGDIVYDLLPFDLGAFFSSPQRLVIPATNMDTGRPAFFEKEDLKGDRELTVLRATASLPMVSRPVFFNNMRLMDGGCSCPVPIERSLEDGNDYNIIVLTRAQGYRKKQKNNRFAIKALYGDYPDFVESLVNQYEIYNRQVELCEQLEQDGKAIIIRPLTPPEVGRYEKDSRKLLALLASGINDAQQKLTEIRKMLEDFS